MTKFLAIETSTETCSVALLVDGRTTERFERAPQRHAEWLLPAIDELLAAAQQPLGGLDAIVFGRGPGSFTSLRIGIGVVQGLAWGADIPVIPVSSLAAVAQEAVSPAPDGARSDRTQPSAVAHAAAFSERRVQGNGTQNIWVALDARMQEVYTGRFELGKDSLVRAAGKECVCSPAELARAITLPFVAAGNGFVRFSALERIGREAVYCDTLVWPRASQLISLAGVWLERNKPLPPEQAQPVYLRNDVAEKPRSG